MVKRLRRTLSPLPDIAQSILTKEGTQVKCPNDNTEMYKHQHTPVVFSATDRSVQELYGCPTCYGTIVLRRHQPIQMISGATPMTSRTLP